MSTTTLAHRQDLPIEELTALLGAEHVITDPAELTFYSTDVYRRADIDAVLVVQPGSVDMPAPQPMSRIRRGRRSGKRSLTHPIVPSPSPAFRSPRPP